VLEGLEQAAREAKKGLWADSTQVPRGNGGRGTSDLARCLTILYSSARRKQKMPGLRHNRKCV